MLAQLRLVGLENVIVRLGRHVDRTWSIEEWFDRRGFECTVDVCFGVSRTSDIAITSLRNSCCLSVVNLVW